MSDRGEVAAGDTRGAAACPGGIQPGDCPPGSGLRVPIAPDDILRSVPPDVAGQARELQESLARRAADKDLRDELESVGFTGPKYRLFEEELTRYAMSVLRAWMYTGRIFKLTAARGHVLYPTDAELEDLHRNSDARDGLAAMTVAVALPKFRERALVGGGWSAEAGASLSTYFMGACLYDFPNEFRRDRVQKEKRQREDSREPEAKIDPGIITDPAVLVTGDIRVREDLARAPKREAAIVALTVDGYSQEEIKEILGAKSARAVEGVLHRWRTKEKQHLGKGGGA
jgi:hypothetical protein